MGKPKALWSPPSLGERDWSESAAKWFDTLATPTRVPLVWSPSVDRANTPAAREGLALAARPYVAMLRARPNSIGWVFFGADRTVIAFTVPNTPEPPQRWWQRWDGPGADRDIVDTGGVVLSLRNAPGHTDGSRVRVHDVRDGRSIASAQPWGRIYCVDGRMIEEKLFERVHRRTITIQSQFADITPTPSGVVAPALAAVAVFFPPRGGHWVEGRAVSYSPGCDVMLRSLIAAQLVAPRYLNWSFE